jgi:hypothetical protein
LIGLKLWPKKMIIRNKFQLGMCSISLLAGMLWNSAAAQTPEPEPVAATQAEQPNSTIDLVVTGPSGAVVPNARVSVANEAGWHLADGITNE